jgi:CHAT domain-containing protein
MREADAGMRVENSWRFRILKADILISRSEGKAAEEVLSFEPPPSDPELLARLRMDQGWAKNLASNYADAEALLDEASRIAKPLGLPSLQATIDNRLGVVQVSEGKLGAAERNLRLVIKVTAGKDAYLNATAMANLGFMFLNSFRMEEAIYWFTKASASFLQLGSTTSYYVTIGNLGSCYQRLGDYDKALAYFRDAEAQARLVGDRYREQLWIGDTGEVLYDCGELQEAANKFRQALAIATLINKDEKDLTAWWYYNLASLSIDREDWDAAEKYNREALRLRRAIGDRSDFYPRINEAHIAAGRGHPQAEELYRGLIAEYRPGMNPVPMLEARAGFAALLARKGKLDEADAQFRGALAALEVQRSALAGVDNRMTYFDRLIRFYDRYINFLVDRGQADRALEVAEFSRARVLDERLESKSSRALVHLSQIRELARSSHTVFLSYWLGKKRSFLWAVTPQEITLHQLPAESEITPLIAGYRSFVENLRDPLKSEYSAGPKLAQMLLGPVRPLLSSGSRVVLVPDRSLYSLNLETLPDPDHLSKYILEQTVVEVAPSLNMLVERRPPAAPADSLLLIGDPQQVVEEYPRLPFAGSEMEQISKAVSSKKETVLEGSHAFPAAYRDALPGQFSWIHFAAHAAANQTTPLDSALILSRGRDETYELLARDVMNVPLNSALVTLSACRSAGVRTYSGEGQVGLSWAFLRAGSRSVVAGLWDVTDRSTATLMADFYDQLARNASPVDALRHAKLKLLQGSNVYRKPFYWGTFQLYAGAL